MKIVNLSQDGDDWLKWRREGITATDSVIILGLSPYKTVWQLWAEKTGFADVEDLSTNPNVLRGVMLEDEARQKFEERFDDLILPMCVESTTHPLIRASLDGLTSNGEPVELKCPGTKNWDDVVENGTKSNAYNLYYPQVQHQILVTEAEKGFLVFYCPGEALVVFEIEPDIEMHKDIVSKGEAFFEAVKTKTAPIKDPEKDTFLPSGNSAAQWVYFADQYRTYESEIKELKDRLAEIQRMQKPVREELEQMMGEFSRADYGGVQITKYVADGRIDYKKAVGELAPDATDEDLEKYRGKPSARSRVTVTDSESPKRIVDKDALAPIKKEKKISAYIG